MHFLSEINVYPVKSCKGLSLSSIKVNKKGGGMDRRWMLIQPDGRFMSQRDYPLMALIQVEVHQDTLVLAVPNKSSLSVPINEKGSPVSVTIWRDTCTAIDQGDVAADYLSQFLETTCRLVYMPDQTFRQVNQNYSTNPSDDVGFADGYPFLLISTASLQDLNQRLDQPVPMNRFRPNLVITNSQPYEEDEWKVIRIGEIVFRVAKPCSRCIITTIDQKTTAKSLEPLKTLATYRKREKGIMFGQNLIHQNEGILNLNDIVEILE